MNGKGRYERYFGERAYLHLTQLPPLPCGEACVTRANSQSGTESDQQPHELGIGAFPSLTFRRDPSPANTLIAACERP